LIGKDATTATIKIELSYGDKVLPAKELKISLEQLADPLKLAASAEKAKFEKLKTGTESVEVKGKRISCGWTLLKVTFDARGKTVESHSKIWVSHEIPLNGLVKMENEVLGNKTTMDLVDYAWGK